MHPDRSCRPPVLYSSLYCRHQSQGAPTNFPRDQSSCVILDQSITQNHHHLDPGRQDPWLWWEPQAWWSLTTPSMEFSKLLNLRCNLYECGAWFLPWNTHTHTYTYHARGYIDILKSSRTQACGVTQVPFLVCSKVLQGWPFLLLHTFQLLALKVNGPFWLWLWYHILPGQSED